MSELNTCKEHRTLEKISAAGSTATKDDVFGKNDEELLRAMLQQDYVSLEPVYHQRLMLHPQGYARLRELKHNRGEFVRWALTTAISVAALIVSIVAMAR